MYVGNAAGGSSLTLLSCVYAAIFSIHPFFEKDFISSNIKPIIKKHTPVENMPNYFVNISPFSYN